MKAQTETDGQQVFFRVGSASLLAGNLPQFLVDSAQAAYARGEKYTVLGVASPEGSYRQNSRLALRRAKAIVKALKKRTGLADSMFLVKTEVADVSTLRDLAVQDENLPEKEAVMALLSAGDATLALLAAVYYYRRKVSSLENELTTARLSEDLSGDRYNEVEERMAASEKALAETEQKFAAAQGELEALRNTDKEFYKNGEALFSYLQNGGVTNGWTSDQTRAFIDYYRLQNSTLIHTEMLQRMIIFQNGI